MVRSSILKSTQLINQVSSGTKSQEKHRNIIKINQDIMDVPFMMPIVKNAVFKLVAQ